MWSPAGLTRSSRNAIGAMHEPDLWTRIKRAKIVQVIVVYLGASWVILQVVDVLLGTLALPEWVGPLVVILLLVGWSSSAPPLGCSPFLPPRNEKRLVRFPGIGRSLPQTLVEAWPRGGSPT